MALIGEQFDEADDICGVVASVRQKQDKLSLWTRTAANEAAQVLSSYNVNVVRPLFSTFIEKFSKITRKFLNNVDGHWKEVEGDH